jgi:hypothetical protein
VDKRSWHKQQFQKLSSSIRSNRFVATNFNMFTSIATIEYRNDKSGPWVTAWMDQEILNYYFEFIPKSNRTLKPRWKAHATVVRPEDNPIIKDVWKKHDGERVELIYTNDIQTERGVWWINLWSKTMEEIRVEMNCSIVSRITRPPWPGYNKCFHCTIGNQF